MCKASKDNRTSPPPRAARQTCVWFCRDPCGLAHEQWWDERTRVNCSPMDENTTRHADYANMVLIALIVPLE